MKVNQNLTTNKHDLWVQVVRTKYVYGNNPFLVINNKRQSSNLWRGICSVWEDFCRCTIWRLGNGRNFNISEDPWVPNMGCLKDVAVHPYDDQVSILCVKDLLDEEGSWCVNAISNSLLQNVLNKILALAPPNSEADDDCVAWSCTADGLLYSFLMYQATLENHGALQFPTFKYIWRWKVPKSYRVFLWRVGNGALHTNWVGIEEVCQMLVTVQFAILMRRPFCTDYVIVTSPKQCGVFCLMWSRLMTFGGMTFKVGC